MSLKVAVVGVGRWGKNHVRNLKKLQTEGEISEILICDISIEEAKNVAKRYGIGEENVYPSVTDLIEKGRPDCAIIAVPTMLHAKVALELLPHVDVFVEKPITSTMEEADTILIEAKKHGRIVQVGHIERFKPVVNTLKQLLGKYAEEGDRVFHFSVQRLGPGPPSGETKSYVSVAHDLLVHEVDIVSFLVGVLPKKVQAMTFNYRGTDFIWDIDARYLYEIEGEKISANMRASWRTSPELKLRVLQAQTSSRLITLDYILQELRIEKGTIRHATTHGISEVLTAYRAKAVEEHFLLSGATEEPLYLEDKHFINCVKKHEKPVVSGEDGRNALKCIIVAIEAAKNGKTIDIT